MANPPTPTHEYRETGDLDEVNRLAAAEGFDLHLAVAVEGGVRYICRRAREPEGNRRVGFTSQAAAAAQAAARAETTSTARPGPRGADRRAAPSR